MPANDQFECPADKSILNAAHAADILIPYSCRSGQCRSCVGRVITGEIIYPEGLPDAINSAEAKAGQVLFCSAYARSDLIIEITKPEF
jgi:CDP-4-dehydro-6-deoxyglucose reductase